MKPLKLICLLLLLTGSIWAQEAAKPTDTLTPDQSKQWADLTAFERQQAERHQQAIVAAVNTPVGELSKDVHAAVQSTWLAVNLARSQKAEWLAKLQAERNCPGCSIVGDKLVKPEGK